ncbi:MAG TPA: hypothetical protein VF301_08230, partial [Ginsengibacter sp.]
GFYDTNNEIATAQQVSAILKFISAPRKDITMVIMDTTTTTPYFFHIPLVIPTERYPRAIN